MKKQRKKRQFNKIYACKKCSKMYKYKGCLFNHFKKFKGHGPLFDVYEKKTESQKSAPLSSINAKLQKIEELLEGGTTYETVTSVTRKRVTRSVKPKVRKEDSFSDFFRNACFPEMRKIFEKRKNGEKVLKELSEEEKKRKRPKADDVAFKNWKAKSNFEKELKSGKRNFFRAKSKKEAIVE